MVLRTSRNPLSPHYLQYIQKDACGRAGTRPRCVCMWLCSCLSMHLHWGEHECVYDCVRVFAGICTDKWTCTMSKCSNHTLYSPRQVLTARAAGEHINRSLYDVPWSPISYVTQTTGGLVPNQYLKRTHSQDIKAVRTIVNIFVSGLHWL
jgi:hypothetical protein